MNITNDDGIIVYGDDIIYMDDWMVEFSEFNSQDEARSYYIHEGYDEDLVDELMNTIESMFYDYCEENDYQGETC